jgi:glycosyltransferase involved in cell wall biosynthesis
MYLSVDKQSELNYFLNTELPYNHYSRKNIGYIYAIREGADVIIDTDDDNVPYKEWTFPSFEGEYDNLDADMGFINIYSLYSEQNIWPRGLPLDKINTKTDRFQLRKKNSNVGVWQALADGDPDVDAIYRLVFDTPCNFKKLAPVVLGHGTITPFNSQNTAFRKELFPLLYLPSTVTFRFTDILRGLVAQPIMWLYDYSLGVTQATVFQDRNPHDYMKDFESEIPCYIMAHSVIELVTSKISSSFSIHDNLIISYEELHKAGIVQKKEIDLVGKWINDLTRHV